MKYVIFAVLLLTACAPLPGRPYQPRTVGECMIERASLGIQQIGMESDLYPYTTMQFCQAEMARRGIKE